MSCGSSQRTPREAGGLLGLAVSKTASIRLESSRLILSLLFANVSLHRFQLVAHGRHRIAPRPEMLSRKVLHLPAKLPRNRHGTLPLQEADNRGYRMLGRDLDTHMDMVS